MATKQTYQVTKGGDIPEIADGKYPADFKGLAEGPTRFGDSIRWLFTVYDDGEPLELDGLSSAKFGRGTSDKPIDITKGYTSKKGGPTKAYFYACAVAGKVFEEDDEITPADLVGKRVEVEIEHNDNEWPTIVNVFGKAKKAAPKAKTDEDDE